MVNEFTQGRRKEIEDMEYSAGEKRAGQQRSDCLPGGIWGGGGGQLSLWRSEEVWERMEFSIFSTCA